MRLVNVKSNTYINSRKEINDKDPKFKIGNTGRISKYKNLFAKGYVPNWSGEVFVITKDKKTPCCGHMLLVILTEKRLLECLKKKELQKTNQKGFRVEKVINRKGDKSYVKWKGCNNLDTAIRLD